MKTFIFECLTAAIAIAQNNNEGTVVEFPVAKDGDNESKGSMREYMVTYDDAGVQVKEVWFEVQWRTGGDLNNNQWVQNYLQMEDPKKPGMYMAMTCTA